jgi:hypothetical protein
MNKCKRCGSYAINHNSHGRDGSDSDLCDVCYWRKRAEALHDALSSLYEAQPYSDQQGYNAALEDAEKVLSLFST